jgi:hypothetical protein
LGTLMPNGQELCNYNKNRKIERGLLSARLKL